MSFYLRVVGLLAKLAEYGHRARIYFVPLHWLLLAPLFFVTVAVGVRLNDGFQAYHGSATFTVDDTFRSFEKRPYFEISGKLLSHGQIIEEDQGNVQRAWAPLTDPNSQKIIYIEQPRPIDEEAGSVDITIKGTLRALEGRLKDEVISSLKNGLSLTQEDLDSLVNLQYIVTQEEPPKGSVLRLVLFFLLVFLVLFLILQSISLGRSKYIVFQREGGFPPSNAEGDATKIEMYTTGLFRLHDSIASDAVYARSYWATLETGQHAIVARLRRPNIPPDPNNIWGIVFRPGSIRSLAPGRLFFGFAAHPSIEVSYTDDVDSASRTCIISFHNNAERHIALSKMLQLQNT